jgi:hypothetical protein
MEGFWLSPVDETNFQSDQISGYVRKITSTGEVYVGWVKGTTPHGEGTLWSVRGNAKKAKYN